LPIRVTEHNSFKSLLDEMKNELDENLKVLNEIVKMLTEEKWEGNGEGSVAYPRMKVLVDPDDKLVRSQVLPVLSEMVNNVRALRSSIAIFKALFSEGELGTELKTRAIWDGSHVRVVIVNTTV